MKGKKKQTAKKVFSYKAEPGIVDKARKKVYKESNGKKSLSGKIADMLYEYATR